MDIIMIIISFILIPASAFLALFAFEMWREQGISIAWPIVPGAFWVASLTILSLQLSKIKWVSALHEFGIAFGILMLVIGVYLAVRYEMDLGDKKGIMGIILACAAGWFLAIGFVF